MSDKYPVEVLQADFGEDIQSFCVRLRQHARQINTDACGCFNGTEFWAHPNSHPSDLVGVWSMTRELYNANRTLAKRGERQPFPSTCTRMRQSELWAMTCIHGPPPLGIKGAIDGTVSVKVNGEIVPLKSAASHSNGNLLLYAIDEPVDGIDS